MEIAEEIVDAVAEATEAGAASGAGAAAIEGVAAEARGATVAAAAP